MPAATCEAFEANLPSSGRNTGATGNVPSNRGEFCPPLWNVENQQEDFTPGLGILRNRENSVLPCLESLEVQNNETQGDGIWSHLNKNLEWIVVMSTSLCPALRRG